MICPKGTALCSFFYNVKIIVCSDVCICIFIMFTLVITLNKCCDLPDVGSCFLYKLQ